MQITLKNIDEIINYEKNARMHSNEQIDQIVNSINEFGFNDPIEIGTDNVIISGHARLAAAIKLGLTKVPVVIHTHLEGSKREAYVLAANKIAMNSTWDLTILKDRLVTLDHEEQLLTGFSEDELDDLLYEEINNQGFTDEDDCPEPQKDTICKLGDIWELGKHRLMCGDSTIITDVEKLIDNYKIDLVFTDPPYGINYQDVKHKHKKIENDENLSNIEVLLTTTLMQKCPMFICCNWKCYSSFEYAMIKFNKNPKACIVWDKESRVQNLDKFAKQHEFILYHGAFGGEKTIDVDVWQCKRQVLDGHPTAKPVELITRALVHFPKAKSILDLFGGSGSTLIACEKTNRKCFMMELDPVYCDVIIKRWEQFTGQKAKRI